MTIEYIYVKSNEDYLKYIKYLTNFPMCGMDTETFVPLELKNKGYTALDCHASKVSLMQIIGHKPKYNQKNEIDYEELGKLSEIFIFDIIELERDNYNPQILINYLISREFVAGVYIQFDLKIIKKQFGVLLTNVVCLKTMSRLIGNATGSKVNKQFGNSLSALCKNYLNIDVSDKGAEAAQGTDWYPRPQPNDSQEIKETFLNKLKYAANDVVYIFPLWLMMYRTLCYPLIESPLLTGTTDINKCGLGMQNVYDLEMAFIPVVTEMEYNGLPLCYTLMEVIEEENRKKLVNVTIELANVLKMPPTINRWTNEYEIEKEFINTLNSPVKLKAILDKLLNVNVTNTTSALIRRSITIIEKLYEYYDSFESDDDDEQDLASSLDSIYKDEEESAFFSNVINNPEFKEVKVVLQLLNQYKQISKLLSQSLLKYVNPITNRMHSSIDNLGAATGRTSSSKGNQQSIDNKNGVFVVVDVDKVFLNILSVII